ncbi:MAG: orotate phosphoribosyltransferase [Deltaproteobacteria bacterium]|uniref:Orotate phosphoribosyltransferase n=1 Tax=Candidatus Zymogenus saltonus TaxID=2844893 RepID=A0A9D8KCN5_9DELT|nr:orotate phosphoribosyltransferase [Candidatus Zymogenus saltonus]
MEELKRRTIGLLLTSGAVRFGEFRLKSGRMSPYFVNLGDLADGRAISELAGLMADKIKADTGLEGFDVVFGPAYKGIVLASALTSSLYERYDVVKGFAYDRKESKTHGEGGDFIGTDLEGKRVLLVDDVITDGKTKIDAIDRLEGETKAEVVGILVVVDRMERGGDGRVFSKVIEDKCNVKVSSLISVIDIIEHIEAAGADGLGISAEVLVELKRFVDYPKE